MSSNCVVLSYSVEEAGMLSWISGAMRKEDHPLVAWGDSVIDVAGADFRQGINYDAIFSGGVGRMQKFRIADEGGWEKDGEAIPFASYDELRQLIRTGFKGLK